MLPSATRDHLLPPPPLTEGNQSWENSPLQVDDDDVRSLQQLDTLCLVLLLAAEGAERLVPRAQNLFFKEQPETVLQSAAIISKAAADATHPNTTQHCQPDTDPLPVGHWSLRSGDPL